MRPRTDSEFRNASPTRIPRDVYEEVSVDNDMAVYVDIGGFQQNVRRAATDGALALEATRAQVELALESHDQFFRGHDETLANIEDPRK